jgi:polyhydroxyalkanoate synthesis regulator protein
MTTFSRNQEQMRKNLADAFGEMFPFKRLEELGRNNMAIFQRAMSMFNPFAQRDAEGKKPADDLSALRAEIDNLQKRLNELGRKE